MTRPRLFLLATMITVLAGIFAYYVWPTPYRYDHVESLAGLMHPVRTNRFTDQVEILYLSGWRRVKP